MSAANKVFCKLIKKCFLQKILQMSPSTAQASPCWGQHLPRFPREILFTAVLRGPEKEGSAGPGTGEEPQGVPPMAHTGRHRHSLCTDNAHTHARRPSRHRDLEGTMVCSTNDNPLSSSLMFFSLKICGIVQSVHEGQMFHRKRLWVTMWLFPP